MLARQIRRLSSRQRHSPEMVKITNEWPAEYYAVGNNFTNQQDEQFPPAAHFEQLSKQEDFASPFYTRALLVLLGGVGLYRLNEYLYPDHDQHPLAKLVKDSRTWLNSQDLQAQRDSFMTRQKHAQDALILDSGSSFGTAKRYNTFPGMFHRASDNLIEVGSQVDVSDIKYQYSWQKNDAVDAFGK